MKKLKWVQELNYKLEYKIGDIVEFKKPHPCGSKQWEIIRTGVDFKFKNLVCEHVITIQRPDALKKIKRIINKGDNK